MICHRDLQNHELNAREWRFILFTLSSNTLVENFRSWLSRGMLKTEKIPLHSTLRAEPPHHKILWQVSMNLKLVHTIYGTQVEKN